MTKSVEYQPKKDYEGSGLVLLQDCALSGAASLLAVLLVRWISGSIPNFSRMVLIWTGVALAATLAGSLLSGSHRVVRRWASFRSSMRLINTILVKEGVMIVLLVSGLVRMPELSLDIVSVMTDALLTTLLMMYIRFAARIFSKSEVRRVKQEAARSNALIAGTDEAAVALANEIRAEKSFNVVGFVSQDPSLAGRVIGDIIVYHCASQQDLDGLEWRLGGVDCIFFPKNGAGKSHASQDNEKQAQKAEEVIPDGLSRGGKVFKRTLDCVLSAVLMLLFSPLALLCAVAIKLEDGGPILYRQERIGKNGKPFNILKFRSMRVDAEADGAQLYAGDDDPRLTKVGGFLRRHHLDELPQLWNVFVGDMSFIGYRPERAVYISEIMAHNPRYRYLYQIRPGVTSYATLYNGYTDTLEKMLTRLDLDLYYLRNRSVLFDARVLGLTFLSIVSGKKF